MDEVEKGPQRSAYVKYFNECKKNAPISFERGVELARLNPSLNPPNFSNGAEMVVNFIAEHCFDYIEDPEGHFSQWDVRKSRPEEGNKYKGSRYTRVPNEQRIMRYIDLARKNYDYWSALKLAASNRLAEGLALGRNLGKWVSKILDDEISAPVRKTGPHKFKNIPRDAAIILAFKKLVEVGLNPTRNSANTEGSQTSACDAILVALGNRGLSMDYKTIESIVYKYQHVPKPGPENSLS